MEIQDRNNIMQLALNLNFDSKTLSNSADGGFIDMIKNLPSAKDDVATDYKTKTLDKSVITNNSKSVNDKPKKVFSADKKAASTNKSDNETSFEDHKDQTKVNKKEYSSDTSVDTEKVTYEQTAANNIDTTENTVSHQENIDNENELSSEIPLWNTIIPTTLSEEAATPDTIETPKETTEAVFNRAAENTLSIDDIIHQQSEINRLPNLKDTSDTTTQSDLLNNIPQFTEQTIEKDDTLIRQVQYFDNKLSPSHHIKIDVNINEEKIAAPVEKNILQNSFEITSMLQNADTAETFTNNKEVIIDDVLMQHQTPLSNNDKIVFSDNRNFAVATPQVLSSEDNIAVNSVHGIDWSAQTLAKTDNVSRLQNSGDNTFTNTLSKEVVEQIKINITKSAVKGVDTIDIQLKPEELGKVQIRLYVSKDGHLHTDIISSRQDTSDLLQREIDNLSKAFQDAGYDADKQSFNFTSQEENQASSRHEEQKLQQFIGDTLEQENEIDQANDNMIYDPKLGLNIRV